MIKVRNTTRNIGLAMLFVLSPLVSFPIILREIVRRNSEMAYFLNACFWGVLGFAFRPTGMCDIVNYWAEVELLKGYEIDQVLRNGAGDFPLLITLLFFLISRTGVKYFVSALYAFVCYGLLTYMIGDSLFQTKVPRDIKYAVLLAIFFFLPAFSVFSSGRYIMATYLFLFGLYREFVKEKRDAFNYLLFVLSLFIHTSMVLYILVYIINKLYPPKREYRFLTFLTFALIFGSSSALYSASLSWLGKGTLAHYAAKVIDLMATYTVNINPDYIAASNSRYVFTKCCLTIGQYIVCSVLLSKYLYREKFGMSVKHEDSFYSFIRYFAMIGLILAVYPSAIFLRYSYTILPAMMILIAFNVHDRKITIPVLFAIIILSAYGAVSLYGYVYSVQMDSQSFKLMYSMLAHDFS